MLEEIYLQRQENIDNTIKQAIKNVKSKMIKIENSEIDKNKKIYQALEENYNIKIASISKEVYLQGLKDGIKLILEAKEIKNIEE